MLAASIALGCSSLLVPILGFELRTWKLLCMPRFGFAILRCSRFCSGFQLSASISTRPITALVIAATNYYPESVGPLLSVGADTSVRDKSNNTALWYAAQQAKPDILLALLRAGASDFNSQDSRGITILMRISEYGNPTNVRVLLDAGAVQSLRDHSGQTALHHAARKIVPDCLNVLLDASAADVNVQDAVDILSSFCSLLPLIF
eukprot:m.645487 g.645487  ORF g.645487 m.645487 type:complete len:205 (-) comp58355_c0_seq40:40-654(-)